MSTSYLDYPVLISQLPIAGKLVNAEQLSPELRREIFQPVLQQLLREDAKKVQEVEKKEKSSTVTRESRGNQNAPQEQRRECKEQAEEEETPSTASNASPWSGNIINVKI